MRWTRSRPARAGGGSAPLGVAVVAGALVVAASLAAAPRTAASPYARELDQITDALSSGRAAEASARCAKASRKIFRERVEHSSNTSGLTAAFYAELMTRCAVAAADGGDASAASWLWHGAQIVDPRRAAEIARALSATARLPPLRALNRRPRPPTGEPPRPPAGDGSGLRPPVKPKRVQIPGELAALNDRCRLSVETVMGTDGRVREPVAVFHDDCSPTQIFYWLETVASWQFEPARLRGEAIETLYTLGMSFRSR